MADVKIQGIIGGEKTTLAATDTFELQEVSNGTSYYATLANMLKGRLTRLAEYNNQTGTTYTILAADSGKVLTFNNAASIAVTLPDTLDTDFQCTVIQIGAGVPTVTRSGTDTINGAATGVTPSAQWKGMYLSQYAAGTWLALL